MQDREADEFRNRTALRDIWQLFHRDRLALFCFYVFLVLIFIAIFSPLLAPYPIDMQFVGQELTPPSWVSQGTVAYFVGTDDIGRDVFSRLLNGTTYTFGGALIVVFITAIVGGVLGILAGMSQGLKARMLGHFLDAFLVVPILLIAIIIATLMEPSLINAMLAISLALLPQFIHEIYQAIQQELKKEYVLTLRLDGISKWILLKKTVLPNITVPYIKQISRAFTIALLDISALSFISLGAQRPTPEWGIMIRDSIELIYLAPWAFILPGFAIIISILVVVVLTNRLCKAILKYYK
ncbi:MAG TPA: peptide ABC transporter permease [Pasteurellaceae bacterium]|nr:peptide ABC transporter permease [Pasteurellaceae bacterium]